MLWTTVKITSWTHFDIIKGSFNVFVGNVKIKSQRMEYTYLCVEVIQ